MKLALVGKNISHSLSPKLQKEIWKDQLTTYDLIDVSDVSQLPSLDELALQYDGINITTPYKEAYVKDVKIVSDLAQVIGAINTISLKDKTATNTDILATEKILTRFYNDNPLVEIHLLGSGVMARMTELIAKKLSIPFHQYSRTTHGDLTNLNLKALDHNALVINACSRSFTFKGDISSQVLFWDFNYSFDPHRYLAQKVKTYFDGQELLWEQAKFAALFWKHKD